ncbi:MAG: hypothetical protein WKF73_09305 [Nocardioidaceae bacterium]
MPPSTPRLCGRRRGRGANKLDDREFAERRRPWDRNSWKVRCEVTLDDGRNVTLQHDLDGKVDCCALDARGRDLSSEIMYEGAPDGSRWLGLNRRTFAATACVNQAELLRVLDSADDLQTDIQRAAATAGKDETAASALDAVKKYCSDQVGLDRANSRRPLRRAIDEHQRARRHSSRLGGSTRNTCVSSSKPIQHSRRPPRQPCRQPARCSGQRVRRAARAEGPVCGDSAGGSGAGCTPVGRAPSEGSCAP